MKIFFIIIQFSALLGLAQTGGKSAFSFLTLPSAARITALGGKPLSIADNDVSLALQNPSLLNDTMHNNISLTALNFFAGIKYGSALYCRNFKKYGVMSAGVQFINYGAFKEADPAGIVTGEFTANEMTLVAGWGKEIPLSGGLEDIFALTFGANAKFIYSSFRENVASAIAADISATLAPINYRYFSISGLIKNVGMPLRNYTTGNREPMPFEVQLSVSEKLPRAPLRFIAVFQSIEKWDLSYTDPADEAKTMSLLTGNEKKSKSWIEKNSDLLFRHFILGAEVVIAKSFFLRCAYNYKLRKEMVFENRKGLTGFSWGFEIRVYKFHLSYGSAAYHLAGGINYFTVSTDLNDFYTPKSEKNIDSY